MTPLFTVVVFKKRLYTIKQLILVGELINVKQTIFPQLGEQKVKI